MKHLRIFSALLILILCMGLCACKKPVPELGTKVDQFQAGAQIDIMDYVYVLETDKIDPSQFKVSLDPAYSYDPYKLGAQEIGFNVSSLDGSDVYSIVKTFTVIDDVNPELKPKSGEGTIEYGAEFNALDYFEYSDLGTPDIKDATVEVFTAIDVMKPGLYEVKVDVTDRGGNKTSAECMVRVSKQIVYPEIGKTYENDGVQFEILSMGFYDTIIPENPAAVYSYLPSQSANGNIFFAVRMRLTLVGEGPVNMKSFFSSSRLYLDYTLKAYGFDMKLDANGTISSNVELNQGESNIFYMVFVVPESTPDGDFPIILSFKNFEEVLYNYYYRFNG